LSIATTNCASSILVFLHTNFEPNHSMMLLKSSKKTCTIIWKSFSSLFSESFQIQDSTSSRYRAPMHWEEREKETIPEKRSVKKVFLPQISTESRYFWVEFKEQRERQRKETLSHGIEHCGHRDCASCKRTSSYSCSPARLRLPPWPRFPGPKWGTQIHRSVSVRLWILGSEIRFKIKRRKFYLMYTIQYNTCIRSIIQNIIHVYIRTYYFERIWNTYYHLNKE
jgi:hypothetical protein